jgi:hypothetical protein
MEERVVKDVYEAPLVQVRGAFFVEELAVSTASFKYGQLELDDWEQDPDWEEDSRTESAAISFY